MVGVVKQQDEGTLAAQLPEPRHEPGIVPFMRDHEVRPAHGLHQIKIPRVVNARFQLGICLMEELANLVAVIADEICPAPRVRRLVNEHLVAGGQQLGGNAAEEVGVSMVPIGNQGMIEHDDFHDAATEGCWVSSR